MTRAAHDQLAQALSTGIANGLLQPGAALPAQDERPWPVTLLTALGAWLAAVPLMGVVYTLLGDMVNKGLGTYVVGVLLLAGAVLVLRSRGVGSFVEQLAVSALLVGGAALSYALVRDIDYSAAGVCLGVLALSMAKVIPQQWLRLLLGGAAALATLMALNPQRLFNGSDPGQLAFWFVLHSALLIWLGAIVAQHSDALLSRSPKAAAWLEPVSTGWLLLVLMGLCTWSGMTFMVSGSFSNTLQRELGQSQMAWSPNSDWRLGAQAASSLLVMAAAGLAVRAWPSLRQAGVALIVIEVALCALSWFLPALGAALFAMAWTATSQRWRLAAVSSMAAAWIVGSFYYQLNWTLANKAALMVALGAVIGAAAWWAGRSKISAEQPGSSVQGKQAGVFIAFGVALTLVVANCSIW